MKRIIITSASILLIVSAVFYGYNEGYFPKDEGNNKIEKTPIRLGWQTQWATQGQIVQALKNVNQIYDKKNIQLSFKL
jgi:hypothetical protein